MEFQLIESESFRRWFDRLRDPEAVARIDARLTRVTVGNLGEVRNLGSGLLEMRIHYGPGYRIYFIREGRSVIMLISGGDKSTQQSDIARARALAEEWRQQ